MMAEATSIVWSCRMDALEKIGSEAADANTPALVEDIKGLTVGKKFRLVCEGPATPEVFKKESLRFDFNVDKNSVEPFKLKLLEVKNMDATHGDFVVTSYLVGDHNPNGVILTDGVNHAGLSGFTWHVQSVIDAKEGEKTQPFGPVGPIPLSFPWSMIAVVLILVLLGAWLATRAWRKISVRRKFLKDVAKYRTARPPVDELFKDLRALDRAFDFSRDQSAKCVQEIDHAFRLFLIREFTIPALTWGMGDILRELKRNSKNTYETSAKSLRKTLVELSRARTRDLLSAHDIKQIATLVSETAEHLSVTQQKQKTGFGRRGHPQ